MEICISLIYYPLFKCIQSKQIKMLRKLGVTFNKFNFSQLIIETQLATSKKYVSKQVILEFP